MGFSGHHARKRFGQHWLRDESVLQRIIEAADLQSTDRVLEVGPGRGALTERLLAAGLKAVHAIELDRDLVDGLQERFEAQPGFSLHQGDVLEAPLELSDGLAARVESLLKQAFLARRKMLRNTLAGVAEPDRLKELAASAGFSLQQRPQELAPATWVALARGLNRGD